jgi:lysophospholipase L1-like esterase
VPTPAVAASKATYYLALGDSVAQGGQPIGGPFSPYASPGYNHGYPEELFKLVYDGYEQLRLENLACGGQSTRTVIEGAPWCSYAKGSQLEQAEAFLGAHLGEVAFVTITIGANDVTGTEADCLDDATITFDLACVQAQLPSIQANVAEIVQRLQAAAPGVPIVGSDYYNPLMGAWVLVPSPIGQFLASASVAPVELLNAGIAAAYGAEGAAVADLYDAFDSANFAELVASEWGLVPANVANACTWTWFCSKQYPGDVHPNNAGHAVIAAAFEEVLPL